MECERKRANVSKRGSWRTLLFLFFSGLSKRKPVKSGEAMLGFVLVVSRSAWRSFASFVVGDLAV